MSNYEAGKLYEAVIDEVITDSRQDFEDSGIDESTLQELKRLWCEKLSRMKVGNFTWDEEDQDLHVQQSLLTNVRNDNLHLSSGLELPNIPYDSGLNAIHNGNISGTNVGTYSMGIEIPTIKQEFNDDTGLIIPKVNQSDGAFELTLEMDSTNANVASIKGLESRLRSQADGAGDGDDDEDEDDIFNDSDDINSDLDDELDSEKSDDDDVDQEGRIMLCLYDKVQRVKNKWKCSLKEGIANIEGRDFVFQRATGESEW